MKLSTDILNIIFFKLSIKDRMRVAQTCTTFKKIADSNYLWKLECTTNNIDMTNKDPKTAYREGLGIIITKPNQNYYLVGDLIVTSKGGGSSATYPIQLHDIPLKEITNSFPKQATVKIFREKNDAILYMQSLQVSEFPTAIDKSPAVFTVNVAADVAAKEQKMQVNWDTWKKRGYAEIKYFELNVNKVTDKISFQLMDYEETLYLVQSENLGCSIM